jgi:hypothetical protein
LALFTTGSGRPRKIVAYVFIIVASPPLTSKKGHPREQFVLSLFRIGVCLPSGTSDIRPEGHLLLLRLDHSYVGRIFRPC